MTGLLQRVFSTRGYRYKNSLFKQPSKKGGRAASAFNGLASQRHRVNLLAYGHSRPMQLPHCLLSKVVLFVFEPIHEPRTAAQ